MDPLRSTVIALPEKGHECREPLCGDNHFITKCELNVVEATNSEGERIPPCKPVRSSSLLKEEHKQVSLKKTSEHNLNEPIELAPRMRLVEVKGKTTAGASNQNEFGLQMNQLVMQAALGGCRWPPYLLLVWVVLLVLSHALHCLVTLLVHALPHLKKFSQYLRLRTEETWQDEKRSNRQATSALLAAATGLAYAIYLSLYALYVTTLWFLEPLCTTNAASADFTLESSAADDATVTNYEEIAKALSQTSSGIVK